MPDRLCRRALGGLLPEKRVRRLLLLIRQHVIERLKPNFPTIAPLVT